MNKSRWASNVGAGSGMHMSPRNFKRGKPATAKANPASAFMHVFKKSLSMFGSRFTHTFYLEVLKMLYEILNKSRREGMMVSVIVHLLALLAILFLPKYVPVRDLVASPTTEDLLRVHPQSYLTAFKELSDAGGGELGVERRRIERGRRGVERHVDEQRAAAGGDERLPDR